MSARNQISIPSLSFHNILFALDFSPGSLLALPFAATIAAHYRSKLFILRILSVEEDQSYPLTSQAALEKLEAGAEAGMFGTLGALKDIPHEFLFDHGSICSTLVAVADKCKVDLIVLGTHGWRGIKKLLKGSTAEEIDFLATRPVLIVGPKVESQPEFKRILFATSVSQTSPVALLYAFSFAHAYQASVVALHVNTPDTDDPDAAEEALNAFRFLRDELQDYAYRDAAKRTEAVVESGPLEERILQFAAAREVDLIVIGLQDSDGIRARIGAHLPGSIAYEVVSRARCPVLTVPLET